MDLLIIILKKYKGKVRSWIGKSEELVYKHVPSLNCNTNRKVVAVWKIKQRH